MKPTTIRRFVLPPSLQLPTHLHFKFTRMSDADVILRGQRWIARYPLGDSTCYLFKDDAELNDNTASFEESFGTFLELLTKVSGVVSFDRLFIKAQPDFILWVDVFSGKLFGIRMVTAKFAGDEIAMAFEKPDFMVGSVEVTSDPAFHPSQMRRSPSESALVWDDLKDSMFRLVGS